MVNAVERVRQRLLLASHTLKAAGVPYAIAGGNAVAAWVATVDEAAARNTQDVDILVRRSDFDAAKAALEGAGFVYRRAAGLEAFLDSAGASPRQAVHLIFANEKVRPHEPVANPDVDESIEGGEFRLLNLEALVRIKLTAFRRKDQVHLLDMIGVGLIDSSWPVKLPRELGERLRELLATPEG